MRPHVHGSRSCPFLVRVHRRTGNWIVVERATNAHLSIFLPDRWNEAMAEAAARCLERTAQRP